MNDEYDDNPDYLDWTMQRDPLYAPPMDPLAILIAEEEAED